MNAPTTPAPPPIATAHAAGERGESWLRAARRARWLAWASLVWMTLEGALGVVAGIAANSTESSSFASGTGFAGASCLGSANHR